MLLPMTTPPPPVLMVDADATGELDAAMSSSISSELDTLDVLLGLPSSPDVALDGLSAEHVVATVVTKEDL